MDLILMRAFIVLLSCLLLSACASYNVTEGQLQSYVNKHATFEKSVGIKGLAYAQIKLNTMKVGIGRVASNRINLNAKTQAILSLLNQPEQTVFLDMSFSAIPVYNQKEGAIYLKELELNKMTVTPNALEPLVKEPLMAPLISLLGERLAEHPIYRLNDSFKDKLIKSANPTLKIENHIITFKW